MNKMGGKKGRRKNAKKRKGGGAEAV